MATSSSSMVPASWSPSSSSSPVAVDKEEYSSEMPADAKPDAYFTALYLLGDPIKMMVDDDISSALYPEFKKPKRREEGKEKRKEAKEPTSGVIDGVVRKIGILD